MKLLGLILGVFAALLIPANIHSWAPDEVGLELKKHNVDLDANNAAIKLDPILRQSNILQKWFKTSKKVKIIVALKSMKAVQTECGRDSYEVFRSTNKMLEKFASMEANNSKLRLHGPTGPMNVLFDHFRTQNVLNCKEQWQKDGLEAHKAMSQTLLERVDRMIQSIMGDVNPSEKSIGTYISLKSYEMWPKIDLNTKARYILNAIRRDPFAGDKHDLRPGKFFDRSESAMAAKTIMNKYIIKVCQQYGKGMELALDQFKLLPYPQRFKTITTSGDFRSIAYRVEFCKDLIHQGKVLTGSIGEYLRKERQF